LCPRLQGTDVVNWLRGEKAQRFEDHLCPGLQGTDVVSWLRGEKTQRFEDHLCPSIQGTDVVNWLRGEKPNVSRTMCVLVFRVHQYILETLIFRLLTN
jgi:hypothetical protein